MKPLARSLLVLTALTGSLAAAALSTPAPLESAPTDAVRKRPTALARGRVQDLEAWLAANPTTRAHLTTDRPLYRPGDTVQVKLWGLTTRGMAPVEGQTFAVELVDPRGLVAQTVDVALRGGGGEASFALDKAAPGGSWELRTTLYTGEVVNRPLVVNSFEAPRVKKTLDFARAGYAPGDTVEAAITLARATGEPLSKATLTAQVQVDGARLPPLSVTTDAKGEALVRFVLPGVIKSPDALLTVLVDDAGVTESISRAVPLAIDDVRVGVFPEGGDLVAGLESRVYFEATDLHGAPVDVRGVVLDDQGAEVTPFTSATDGRGRFVFTPQAGRSYRLRVLDHADLADVPLPQAQAAGCVLRHFDDLEGAQTSVRVRVACTSAQDVTLLATQQEQIFDRATVHVEAPTTVWLRSGVPELARAQGVARVTLFDAEQRPLAERLVLRNRARGMKVTVQADKASYAPGEEVRLAVRTTDAEGAPVPAQLALSVVDDTLLALADDDAHSLSSSVLLQADLPEPIEGASRWFTDPDGGLALDLALGTRGWRRFDWTQVDGFYARQQEQLQMQMLGYMGYEDDLDHVRMRGAGAMADMAAPVAVQAAAAPVARKAMEREEAKPKMPSVDAPAPARDFAPALPAPAPRTDFRDTVLWSPAVLTGADGAATVRFALNDAVTSFRVHAEGIGAGLLGGGEALIASRLPLHVEARLPVALSTGDHLELPVTLENQLGAPLEIGLTAGLGDLLRLSAAPGAVALAAGERRTVWVGMDVLPGYGEARVALDAEGSGARDGIVRSIPVVPRGVPRTWSAAGRLDAPLSHELRIPEDALPGSISGRLTLLPSPIAEVMEGIEQMVRTPGGCFEQTSSTNWPNVVVLDLLERADATGKLQVDRKQVLDAGYNILTGYQVGTGGFETWGSGPGKEALTAYGLLEFTDMDRVYDVSPKILSDSAQYLLDQRNGTGGYKVTGSSAHGYGTAPPEVLDAYITYALVETGHTDLPRELDQSAALARTSRDPYRMGLATLTLLKARPTEGKAAAQRLAGLQAADGGFPGSETSITRSENYNLDVEATALAAMALLRAGDVAHAQRAVAWLHDNQTGPGQWGATQGNALALRAIGEAAAMATMGKAPGQLEVRVDGELVHQATVEPGGRDPLPFDLGPYLRVGAHRVDLRLDGLSVPYALQAGWTTERPDSDPERRVDLAMALANTEVAVGHTVRATATLTNRTQEVVPDPIARIGLPAGLEAQVWQLEAMKKRGEIAFFELRPREVTVYWDGLGVGEVHTVALDLTATTPGRFTAPASSAYPYYDDQDKAWVAGAVVTVQR